MYSTLRLQTLHARTLLHWPSSSKSRYDYAFLAIQWSATKSTGLQQLGALPHVLCTVNMWTHLMSWLP